jgi:hypothetical protein
MTWKQIALIQVAAVPIVTVQTRIRLRTLHWDRHMSLPTSMNSDYIKKNRVGV